MNSGTASRSVDDAMSGFTRKAGARGVLDSGRSLAVLLVAMIKHPFGIHDWVDEYEIVWKTTRTDGTALVTAEPVTRCWLCEARALST